MDHQEFQVKVSRGDGATAVSLAGDLDLTSVGEFSRAVDQALADGSHIEIDLTRLNFIDSSGLNALLAIHNSSESREFTYRLLAGPPKIHRTFELAGLDKVLVFA